jgi:hypothetical protein
MEQAIANVLYEGDTDDYELVEEEKEKVEEELNKWYPIVDEGEYWTESDMNNTSGYRTIVTDGSRIFTFQSNKEGWSTMARRLFAFKTSTRKNRKNILCLGLIGITMSLN